MWPQYGFVETSNSSAILTGARMEASTSEADQRERDFVDLKLKVEYPCHFAENLDRRRHHSFVAHTVMCDSLENSFLRDVSFQKGAN